MSYTFGGGTGDDITTAAIGGTLAGNQSSAIWAGWFYPTTLTATRAYCSAGNVISMVVDTATDELRFITDNTTDGEWTSAGADITVDKWWFIAFAMAALNAGPALGIRCWTGDVNGIEERVLTNVVTPVGNFTGSQNMTAGNKGTGTLAFQGDVGWLCKIASNDTSIIAPTQIDARGAISDSDAIKILNRWVRPLWLGRPDNAFLSYVDHSTTTSILHMPMTGKGEYYAWQSNDAALIVTASPTINGATFSERRPPTAPPANWPICRPLPRL